MRAVRSVCGTGLLLFSCILAGCGSDSFSVAPAKGSVVFSGAPVTGGSVTLVPIVADDQKLAGKPAKGEVTADGSFVLSTYDRFDGAVVGRHRVIYESPEGSEGEESAAEGEDEPAAQRADQRKSGKPSNLQVRPGTEVEVKSGSENVFQIELTEAPANQSEDAE